MDIQSRCYFPNEDNKIKEMITQQILQELKNDILDVGITSTPLENEMKWSRSWRFYYEVLIAFMSATHGLSKKNFLHPEDLDIKDILLL